MTLRFLLALPVALLMLTGSAAGFQQAISHYRGTLIALPDPPPTALAVRLSELERRPTFHSAIGPCVLFSIPHPRDEVARIRAEDGKNDNLP
ncbi:hypothetical protein [Parvularcula dongshanensis]|uniref:Uncharacterized protein n=1 Tax=Parvularcula dongshanensis TaxID=1173995 RepID=A0A840I0C3_9PROT|nr:hypothetical protein [Parvularcula dongshanensis]MBB4658516.1 hypothetical protein [Parvularcula dongshanensis]